MLDPASSVLRRTRNSIAYRSSALFRCLLASWFPRRVSVKPPIEVTYLTFAGAMHLTMLRESVSSLANAWDRFPRLRVVGDGTVSNDTIRGTLSFWPAEIEILDWRDLVDSIYGKPYEAIVQFAEHVPMARKMLAIVASALDAPTMYADVDVLWFRTPTALFGGSNLTNPRLVMSPDFQPSYDANLVPRVLPHLADPPFYCAGILFANGDFLGACKLEHLIEYASQNGVALTEQTIFAEANHQLGGEVFAASEFILNDRDRFSFGPSFIHQQWIARHYIGQVRHLFWRDALALRLGIDPTS